MKYSLVYEPFEQESEDVTNTIEFEENEDDDAKIKMCSLFYGYENIDDMYEEFEYKIGDNKEQFIDFIMNYFEKYNGSKELDFYISLKNNSTNQTIWETKTTREEIDEEDFM
jgi:hypothetical protein